MARISKRMQEVKSLLHSLIALTGVLMPFAVMGAWEPEKPVELIVPGGAGGDLDQRARLMQDIIAEHHLMKQPLSLVYKPGGGGAEGFLAVKNSQGNAYQLLIADNRLLSVPLVTGIPFNWKDTTPVAMLALEQFVLWTNSKSGFKSAKEYIETVKAGGYDKFNYGKFKMGGTGSGGAPDRFLTFALDGEYFIRFIYVPLKSGAVVADQLAKKNIDSTVNSPSEARDHWRSGALTPQCVFDDARMPYTAKVTASQSWSDIPTCREAGIPLDHQKLWGVFMPPGVSFEQANYFIEVFRRMEATPEWKSYMESGAFKQNFRTDSDFIDWLTNAEKFHQALKWRLEIREPVK